MNKHLQYDFDIPEHTHKWLDSLLDRTFSLIGLLPGDNRHQANTKFVTELRKIKMSSLTFNVAVTAWLKATGQDLNRELLEYTEVSVLIGYLAIMLGDRPPIKYPYDPVTGEWKP